MNKLPPCNPPANAPADYCSKLRGGINRLKQHIHALYENIHPEGGEWIQRAVREAEEGAWQTPFPSLFFLPLAHARITEMRGEAGSGPQA